MDIFDFTVHHDKYDNRIHYNIHIMVAYHNT